MEPHVWSLESWARSCLRAGDPGPATHLPEPGQLQVQDGLMVPPTTDAWRGGAQLHPRSVPHDHPRGQAGVSPASQGHRDCREVLTEGHGGPAGERQPGLCPPTWPWAPTLHLQQQGQPGVRLQPLGGWLWIPVAGWRAESGAGGGPSPPVSGRPVPSVWSAQRTPAQPGPPGKSDTIHIPGGT